MRFDSTRVEASRFDSTRLDSIRFNANPFQSVRVGSIQDNFKLTRIVVDSVRDRLGIYRKRFGSIRFNRMRLCLILFTLNPLDWSRFDSILFVSESTRLHSIKLDSTRCDPMSIGTRFGFGLELDRSRFGLLFGFGYRFGLGFCIRSGLGVGFGLRFGFGLGSESGSLFTENEPFGNNIAESYRFVKKKLILRSV